MSGKQLDCFSVIVVGIFLMISAISPVAVSIDDPNDYGEESEFPYPGDDWTWDMIGIEYTHRMGECGEGVRVAVLDTGIDYDHPDLEGYRIYCGTEKEELELLEEVGSDQLHHRDIDVGNETIYYYTVTAYSDEGESFKTEPVNSTLTPKSEGDLLSRLTNRDIQIVPSVIIISGLLLFILFTLALYRRERGLDR